MRDGHGDLRCEHVLLGEPVKVVDRIEFDPALRQIDVGCDLAFLLMDLERLGGAAPARELLSAYRRAGGDPGSEELVWFNAAYWALVRTKVALIAAGQRGGGSAGGRAGVRPLSELAARLCWRARGPVAVLVAGPPASGKSTLARELSARSGLPIVSSDETRKRLAGVAPRERAGPGSYTGEFTEATYLELGRAATARLAEGSGVLIDATCGREAQREELIGALDVDRGRVLFVESRVPLACALERAAARTRDAGNVSDATPAVVARLFANHEEIREPAGFEVLRLDGRAPLKIQAEAVTAAADTLLAAPR